MLQKESKNKQKNSKKHIKLKLWELKDKEKKIPITSENLKTLLSAFLENTRQKLHWRHRGFEKLTRF